MQARYHLLVPHLPRFRKSRGHCDEAGPSSVEEVTGVAVGVVHEVVLMLRFSSQNAPPE